MIVNEDFIVTEIQQTRRLSSNIPDHVERVYTYDEAIDLAGNGLYSLMLLTALSISFLAMALDIFGFSVVVTGAQCELNLGVNETSILFSVTFIGPILMAYPWGYISDTQGRRKSLIISLWTSFLVSMAGAFSPNWITLAVSKLISTSFSSCAQSVTFVLLGESCSQRHRNVYMLIMASISDFNPVIYSVMAYFILKMEFAYNLGFINLVPWRILCIALSMVTGLGALGVLFCYESPKFLLSLEKHDEAIHILTQIWKMNGAKQKFPVKKVILNETNIRRFKECSVKSFLWEQISPIFKPPKLWRSLQLLLLNAVIYSTNNNFSMWLPYLGQQVVEYTKSNDTDDLANICSMIESNNITNRETTTCTSTMDQTVVWFILAQGAIYGVMVILLTFVAHRKRALIITICLLSSICSVSVVLIDDRITSFIMFLGILINQLVIGLVYSYFVELYPTSCRGMAACLGTMVARLSALLAVYVFGSFLASYCSQSFYLSGAVLLCGVIVAIFLPPDKIISKP